MNGKNPADYVIGPDATIEDGDLDGMEVYYQGERLTEARAAELGELAAREAREGRQHDLIPDRRSVSGEEHPPVMQLRVSEATLEKLEAIATARGISIAKLSREVLDEFAARQTG
jgi:predicted HicB family RNase H-like nuclease